ncbi:MAG: radical SAM protein [archaeon]|nr:radical SAM protein [archaeon]
MNKIQKLAERFAPVKEDSIKFLNYAVTNLCNSKCTTCNIWQLYRPGPYDLGKDVFLSEVKAEDIRKAFKDSKCFANIKNVNLTGGEPFLKKDFVEIILTFRELFPEAKFNITSNGLETDYTVKKLKELASHEIFPNITFSIDGMEHEHDRVRGVDGGYNKTMNTILLVQKEISELKMALSFTINPTNYKELPLVFAKSKELGIAFITRYALVNPGFYFNNDMPLNWDPEALIETHQMLMQIKKEKNEHVNPLVGVFSAEKYFFNNMTKQLDVEKRTYECFSGTQGFFMDPYGNIKSCYILEQIFGNIKKQSFDELWFSENAKKARAFIAARKCNCWTECDTIPSLEKNNLMVVKDNLADALHL